MALDNQLGDDRRTVHLKTIEIFNIGKALPTHGLVRGLEGLARIDAVHSEEEFISYVCEHPEEIFELYCGQTFDATEKELFVQGLLGYGVVVNDTGVYVNGKQMYSSSPIEEAERQRIFAEEDKKHLTREQFKQLHQARQESGEPL